MGRYEVLLVMNSDLSRDVLKTVMKNIMRVLIDRDGVVRNLTNHGAQQLPTRMQRHGVTVTNGTFFVMEILHEARKLKSFEDLLKLEVGLVRHEIINLKDVGHELRREGRPISSV